MEFWFEDVHVVLVPRAAKEAAAMKLDVPVATKRTTDNRCRCSPTEHPL